MFCHSKRLLLLLLGVHLHENSLLYSHIFVIFKEVEFINKAFIIVFINGIFKLLLQQNLFSNK